MSDVIQLLPDSVANQIAAGEVIQRPASIVKELVENSIDAGSNKIQIIIKDGGKSLVQVIDNGCGMSETDARLAFERHATSKIKKAADLFNLHTLGFRGEALASIAAVASVELRTKRNVEELGTLIEINGSELQRQESVNCPQGSNFMVKNLFFNIPARRKFLKANSSEFRHIVREFQRIALVKPNIEFHLHHNDNEIYNLPATGKRQRIINMFGKSRKKMLIDVKTETSVINIKGYIGKPEAARKTTGEQFMFINGRYMHNGLFHKIIMQAYENMIQKDTLPIYFIYFETDPATIDVNIHPTKTEIKFENNNEIIQILRVALREAMGKVNIMPSIDFDQEGSIEIPTPNTSFEITSPQIEVNPEFNPFEAVKQHFSSNTFLQENNRNNWEKLYEGIEEQAQKFFPEKNDIIKQNIKEEHEIPYQNEKTFFQLKNKYILTSVKSGLMLIDQNRAHRRILYERYTDIMKKNMGVSQQKLFPLTIELNKEDLDIIIEIKENISLMGFDIEIVDNNNIKVKGTPADLKNANPKALIEELLENYKQETANEKQLSERDFIARSMAKTAAINYGQQLKEVEMHEIIDSLFACEIPNYTPDGEIIINIISIEEFDKRF